MLFCFLSVLRVYQTPPLQFGRGTLLPTTHPGKLRPSSALVIPARRY